MEARKRPWVGFAASLAVATGGCAARVPGKQPAVVASSTTLRAGSLGALRWGGDVCVAVPFEKGYSLYDVAVDWANRDIWFVLQHLAPTRLEIWKWDSRSGVVAKVHDLPTTIGQIGVRNGLVVWHADADGERCTLVADRFDGSPQIELVENIGCRGSIAVGDGAVWFDSDYQIRRVSLSGGPSVLVAGGSEVALNPSGTHLAHAIGGREIQITDVVDRPWAGEVRSYSIPIDTGLYDLHGSRLGWNEDGSLTVATWDWTLLGLLRGVPRTCPTVSRIDIKTGRIKRIFKDVCIFPILLSKLPTCPTQPANVEAKARETSGQ